MEQANSSKTGRLYNPKYYTAWSNILFYTTIIAIVISKLSTNKNLIPSWFYFAVFVNMIAVGLIGNILTLNFGKGVENVPIDCNTKKTLIREIDNSNFIVHTIPLIISFILLIITVKTSCNCFNILYSFFFLILFAFIWLITPYNGLIFVDKVKAVYLNCPLSKFALLPIIWIIGIYSINFLLINSSIL